MKLSKMLWIIQINLIGILSIGTVVTGETCLKPFSQMTIHFTHSPVTFGKTLYLRCHVISSESFCGDVIKVVHLGNDDNVLQEFNLTQHNRNGRKIGYYGDSEIRASCNWFQGDMFGIVIERVTTQHSGNWMCSYNNTVFTRINRLNVTVAPSGADIDYEPKTHRMFKTSDYGKNLYVEQGTRLVLKCDGDGPGVTQPISYEWVKGKGLMLTRAPESLGRMKNVVIPAVNGSHDAWYSCIKTNIAGKIQKFIIVRVYCISLYGTFLTSCNGPPAIKYEESKLKRVVREGKNAKFSVKYEARTNLKYMEYTQKRDLRTTMSCAADSEIQDQLLDSCRFEMKLENQTWTIRVMNVSVHDYGSYTCLIQNQIGFTDFKIKLLHPGIPNRVGDLRVKATTATSISVNWKVNPNSSDAYYIVEYRINRSGSGWSHKTSPVNSVTVIGLQPATRYEFRVRGHDSRSNPQTSLPSKSVRTKTKGINGILRWIKRIKVTQTTTGGVTVELPSLRNNDNHVIKFLLCNHDNESSCQSFNFTTPISYLLLPADSSAVYDYRMYVYDDDVIVHSTNSKPIKGSSDGDDCVILITCSTMLILTFMAAIFVACCRRRNSRKKMAGVEKK